ncbi:MAG: ATP-binding protein [Planctomycetes bacterium]|nr:ATP-binding protein [Planctomycetota bacterium]
MTGKTAQKEITIQCDPRFLQEVRGMVAELWNSAGLPEHEGGLVVHAVDEAISSMLWHAKDTNRRGEIHILLDLDDVRFRAVINDQTNHLNVDGLTEHEMDEHLDRERKYQLGIFLMREICDEVSYSYKKGFQNELVLVKFLRPTEG